MTKQPLQEMTQKSKTMLAFINFLYWASIIIIGAISIAIVISLLLPSRFFHLEKVDEFWYIYLSKTEGEGLFIGVPFKLLPAFINESVLKTKTVFITIITFFFLPFFIVFCYGIKQIKLILESLLNKPTPFIENNTSRLKKLAWIVIIYSLIGKLFINLMMILFVTNTMLINIDINFTGVFVGFSLLIIANVFQYGTFLQEEYDTTL